MDETIKFPHGYRFNPFEEELINFYLKPKVLGQKLSCDVVKERQLYGPNANPWEVFDPEKHSWILSEVTPGRFEKITYVFVNLTKKGAVERKKKPGRDNYIKKAGCGTWDGQTKRSEIRDSKGVFIGEKRFLVFEINDPSDQDLSKLGYWKMHEYHLSGVNEDIVNSNNTVLCKITLDYSKTPPVKLRVKTSTKPAQNYGQAITTKEKQGYSQAQVEICDTVECINTSNIEDDIVVIPTSPPSEQLDTGYNPLSSNFCWPAMNNKDDTKIKKERGRGDLHLGVTNVQFSDYSKPQEQSIEDTTTDLGKRKFQVETSCVTTKKLKPVSSDFCLLTNHDDDYQKNIKEAGGKEELINNFINFL